jgi:hypothetical protein
MSRYSLEELLVESEIPQVKLVPLNKRINKSNMSGGYDTETSDISSVTTDSEENHQMGGSNFDEWSYNNYGQKSGEWYSDEPENNLSQFAALLEKKYDNLVAETNKQRGGSNATISNRILNEARKLKDVKRLDDNSSFNLRHSYYGGSVDIELSTSSEPVHASLFGGAKKNMETSSVSSSSNGASELSVIKVYNSVTQHVKNNNEEVKKGLEAQKITYKGIVAASAMFVKEATKDVGKTDLSLLLKKSIELVDKKKSDVYAEAVKQSQRIEKEKKEKKDEKKKKMPGASFRMF